MTSLRRHKRRMNNKKPQRRTIRPADAAKGAAGETRFQQWLEASDVGFFNIEQTPLTMPKNLRSEYKRADYIIGIRDTGQLAFEVKAKTIYPDGLIFDLKEVKGLRVFSREMCMSVVFACLDPEGGSQAYWVRLDQLDFARVTMRGGKPTVACALDRALGVDMTFSFWDAYFETIKR